MKKAIVVGSSTGIGRALVQVLAEEGYEVGLAGRNVALMEELAAAIPTRGYVMAMDVSRTEEARSRLRELIDAMGDVELIVASAALDYFVERGSGHVTGITSIAGLRGLRAAYSGSKAFGSVYLEALRLKADYAGADVTVTDVKPGFVATPMTEGREDMFWLATPEEAARQIYEAIRKKRRHVYVTRRWRLMAWVMKVMPYPLVSWISTRRQYR